MVYGENPFYDATDTVRAELHPPHLEVHFLLIMSLHLYSLYILCLFVFLGVCLFLTDKRQNG